MGPPIAHRPKQDQLRNVQDPMQSEVQETLFKTHYEFLSAGPCATHCRACMSIRLALCSRQKPMQYPNFSPHPTSNHQQVLSAPTLNISRIEALSHHNHVILAIMISLLDCYNCLLDVLPASLLAPNNLVFKEQPVSLFSMNQIISFPTQNHPMASHQA